MSDDFDEFLKWEAASRNTIDLKVAYVDIAGDLVAGLLADAVKQYPSSSAIAKMVEDEQLVTALDDFYDSTVEAAMKLIDEGDTKDDWKDVRDDAIERAALVFRRCAELPEEANTERATEQSR